MQLTADIALQDFGTGEYLAPHPTKGPGFSTMTRDPSKARRYTQSEAKRIMATCPVRYVMARLPVKRETLV